MKKGYIIKRLTNELKKIKEIKAIAVHGSLAYSKGDKYSDMDIVCFCIKIPSREKRNIIIEPIVQKLNWHIDKPKEYMETTDYFKYNSIEGGIDYKSIKKLKDSLNKFSKKTATLRETKEVLNYIYNIKIIYDPENIVKNLKKDIPKPTQVFVNSSLYFIKSRVLGEGLESAIKRKNYLQINSIFEEGILNYLLTLYSLNNRYFSHYKEAFFSLKNLKKKPKNCMKKLQKIAKLGNSEKEIKTKVKLFRSLYEDLIKIKRD